MSTRLSSRSTFLAKRVYPILTVVFIALFVSRVLAGRHFYARDLVWVILPIGILVYSFVVLKKSVWPMADEVVDHGDYLQVRRGAEEDRVALSNISNVSATSAGNAPMVSLRLRRPGKFGSEISFLPVGGYIVLPFRKNAVAEGLIARVEKARSGLAV